MGDDGLAVADRLAVVDDVGELAAWRLRGVEDVVVPARDAGQPQEGEQLQAVAVVVSDAKQRGIRIEGYHRIPHGSEHSRPPRLGFSARQPAWVMNVAFRVTLARPLRL